MQSLLQKDISDLVVNLVQAEEERRMASCEKTNFFPIYFSCGQTENQLPSVAVSIMDRCQVGHRMKKHPCSHCSKHIQSWVESLMLAIPQL